MDKTTRESSEKQQLVGDEDEDTRPGPLSLSPAASGVQLSSGGNARQGSKPQPPRYISPNPTIHGTTRVAFVSERKPARPPRHTDSTASGMGMRGADARKTQASLLRLLATFRATPPSSDTPGAMPPGLSHMEDIREQQENLARLHFKLGSDPDAPAKPASARETMAQLVKNLEHLSTSIEQLHLTTDFHTNTIETIDENDSPSK